MTARFHGQSQSVVESTETDTPGLLPESIAMPTYSKLNSTMWRQNQTAVDKSIDLFKVLESLTRACIATKQLKSLLIPGPKARLAMRRVAK